MEQQPPRNGEAVPSKHITLPLMTYVAPLNRHLMAGGRNGVA